METDSTAATADESSTPTPQTRILHLSITSDKSPYPYQTRYPATMALVEFKVKLEVVVGTYVQDMRLELRSEDGRFLGELFGDDRTLEELGVHDKSVIHVRDASGNGPIGGEEGAAGTRYVMSDDKYDARKDSVRKWMQELGVKSPSTVDDPLPEHIQLGRRVFVHVGGSEQPAKTGQIAFIGSVHFKPGVWVGVVYDAAVGKNDGSIDGHRYFQCEPGHGSFVIPKSVHPAESN